MGGTRRPGLCGSWMHRGALLRAPYHNAMHYHHAPDLLLLHVPTSTLDEGTRRPGLCGNWMHRGALLRAPYHNAMHYHNCCACRTVHNCCACLTMHNPCNALVLRRRRRGRSESTGGETKCRNFEGFFLDGPPHVCFVLCWWSGCCSCDKEGRSRTYGASTLGGASGRRGSVVGWQRCRNAASLKREPLV